MSRQQVTGPSTLAIGTGASTTQGQYTATRVPATWTAQVTSDGTLSPGDYTVSISSNGLLTITLAPGVVVPAPGTTMTVAVSASSGPGNGNNDTLNVTVAIDPTVVPCFLAGTFIATETGETLVEDLKAGDRIKRADGGTAVIRWVGSLKVSRSQLERSEKGRPVRFPRNCFAENQPDRDLYLSPLHRIRLSGWQAELLYGEPSVFVHAAHLPEARPVTCPDTDITYHHLLCDRHEVILANGVPTETLFPGELAQLAFAPETVQQILHSLPVSEAINAPAPRTALRCLGFKESRLLHMTPAGRA